ncbi:MAG: TorD/DmsD family molecular chaperone [Desulfitobacteriaceae bacterium]
MYSGDTENNKDGIALDVLVGVRSNQVFLFESAQLYDLLRCLFLSGPDAEIMSALNHLELTKLNELQADFVSNLSSLKDSAGKQGASGALASLQTEFTRLFIGPGKAPAYPYESLYRSPQRLLMTEVTSEVRNFYLEHGLLMQKLYTVPEDHLGVELEFLYYLNLKMLEQPENIPVLRQVQLQFLQEHPLSWIDDFTQDVLANTEEPFFANLALLLKNFLHWDAGLLNN